MAEIKGGEKLTEKLQELSKNVSKKASLAVGFLENATYPDGTPVAMVAASQEFGAPQVGIPPRPFFRTMVTEKSPKWGEAVGNLLKASDYDAVKALGQAGAGIASQLQQSITDTNSPALAQSTIDRKGFAKPLVDTGHMQNSVDYQVDSE